MIVGVGKTAAGDGGWVVSVVGGAAELAGVLGLGLAGSRGGRWVAQQGSGSRGLPMVEVGRGQVWQLHTVAQLEEGGQGQEVDSM
jgi:hypothetical protein